MKLRDLDARLFGETAGMASVDRESVDGAQGLVFQCPSCAIGKERGEEDGRRFVRGAHSIRVCFSNPRGASPVSDAFAGGMPRWELVSGTSIDDITLSPSINCDIPWEDEQGVQHESSCKFHGYVKNGRAFPPDGDVEQFTLSPRIPMEDPNTPAADAPAVDSVVDISPAADAPVTDTTATPDPAPAVDPPADPVPHIQPEPEPDVTEPDVTGSPGAAASTTTPAVDPMVTVRALAPGFDGLKFREVGEVFVVPASTIATWMRRQ